MAQDPIDKYDGTEPKATTKVKNGPTVIPRNWDAVENMVGLGMYGLEIVQTAGKTATIDYTSLTLVQNTATPPLIFVDLSPTQIAMDWDNGVAMDGRETGLATTVGWKYLWVFRDAVNGVTSGLWSAATAVGSVAEPDADFKFGRLVGAGYWDGVSAFTAFIQRDRRVTLIAPVTVTSGGRSDSAWTSQSLTTRVPTLAKRVVGWLKREQATGTAGNRQLTARLAADNSGNYEGAYLDFFMAGVGGTNNGQMIFRDPFEQELTSQAISYWTFETGPNLFLDIILTSYWLEI